MKAQNPYVGAVGVMARCPRCKGWTMFHADGDSDTGREWAAQCRLFGDVIEPLGDAPQAQLGRACKSADVNADRRTCEVSP